VRPAAQPRLPGIPVIRKFGTSILHYFDVRLVGTWAVASWATVTVGDLERPDYQRREWRLETYRNVSDRQTIYPLSEWVKNRRLALAFRLQLSPVICGIVVLDFLLQASRVLVPVRTCGTSLVPCVRVCVPVRRVLARECGNRKWIWQSGILTRDFVASTSLRNLAIRVATVLGYRAFQVFNFMLISSSWRRELVSRDGTCDKKLQFIFLTHIAQWFAISHVEYAWASWVYCELLWIEADLSLEWLDSVSFLSYGILTGSYVWRILSALFGETVS
jgi:hypothetical protein